MTLKRFAYLTLSILLFSCSDTKKETDTSAESIVEEKVIGVSSYSDSIWKIVSKDLTDCSNPITVNFDNKIWTYCKQKNDLELYQVEYVENNIGFTEKFLLRDKQLIYAVEWEKRTADLKDDEATWWNCEYIIKDNHVVDHMSLGTGRTEEESFDIQDIINLWNTRKDEFPD